MNDIRCKHYKIVQGRPQEVEDEVNLFIERGYQLYGEPINYCSPSSKENIVLQPMIKVQEEK